MKKFTFDYQDGSTLLEAFCAYEPKAAELQGGAVEKRPAVLVFHAWNGRDDLVAQKAEALAVLGYVGIAVDVYGKGVLGKSKEENQKLMQPFKEDRVRWSVFTDYSIRPVRLSLKRLRLRS